MAAVFYAVAAITTVALWEPIFFRVPFALFFAAVVLTAWVAAFGPSVAVAFAGTVTTATLMSSPSQTALAAPLMLLVIAVFMAYLVKLRTGDQRRLAATHAAKEFERARLEAVVEQMPLGVIIADAPSGNIVLANKAAARILRHEIEGGGSVESYSKYRGVHSDGRPYQAAEYPLARALMTGETVTNEQIEYLCGDGTRRLLEVSAAPIHERESRVVAALVVFADVTDERALEQQVGQSQRLEAVGRLAGGVAHDFNNLLTVIMGSGTFALESLAEDDPVRAHVEEMTRSAHRAADLTRQLLAFSRRQLIQPRVVDLNALIPGLVKMLQRLLGEDIELITRLSPALGRVKADPGQLEQVITNLAVNARDAMRRGGRLTIETANVDLTEAYAMQHADVQPGPHVMLAVSDTGVGMDRETQARLFEPFFTTKAMGHGTGLGLATVYGIVKQSGGHIWVYSEPERGTTFKVYLPRVDEAVAETAQPSGAPGVARGSETVLLVEDEETVRKLVRDVITRGGYTVMECRNADEAEFMSGNFGGPIHLLITDVVMPGRSGRELAARIASQRPAVKVLYMSGYTDNAIAHHGVIDPGVAFLEKPFTPEQLLRKARQVLDEGVKP